MYICTKGVFDVGIKSFNAGHYHRKLTQNINSEGHSAHRVSRVCYSIFKCMVVMQKNHIVFCYTLCFSSMLFSASFFIVSVEIFFGAGICLSPT